MASWKYESKAGVLATDVDAEKVASLRVILRQGGDGRAANDVYNMSPAELRASVDEARLLDRNQLINELASLTGQSATDAETANEGASDTDLYDRVWDTQVKKKLWKLSGNDPDDYDGDDLSIEDFARHREAELWRAERDWVEERVREIDPNADQDDVSELTDDQLAEKLNELAAKAADKVREQQQAAEPPAET